MVANRKLDSDIKLDTFVDRNVDQEPPEAWAIHPLEDLTKMFNQKKNSEIPSFLHKHINLNSYVCSFKNFFSEFDEMLTSLGVRSYGVGITTLEEVFLKIGSGEAIER